MKSALLTNKSKQRKKSYNRLNFHITQIGLTNQDTQIKNR